MSQSLFAAALLDPEAAVPAGLVDPTGRPAPKRFSVYRNNVASSLTRALEAAFPTVRKLVGDEFFAAMAVVFLRAHPPKSRMLMLYGEEMPVFLESFPPVAHLGYLPDMARLDQAMRESYHAADSQPLSEAAFQRLLGEDIAALRLRLAPSLRLIRSRWPICAIWAANHEGGPKPAPKAEDALVLRPEFDPRPWPLPAGGGVLVQELLAGRTLGESLDTAGEMPDLPNILGHLVAGRAIIGVLE
ncbi:MAG: putative DNA-binding domain-containing protein [Tabrizicola sp.]|nr:putative DNA-binding domain-containing protein [Tabrizicola sp.]